MRRLFAFIAVAVLMNACGEQETAEAPPPAELTRDAVGRYCGMIVEDHDGPKGQIFLAGAESPFWFTSVRDTVAFTKLPEESDDIAAIYVTDMSVAESWDSPGPESWLPAEEAVYAIGSSRRGGMGALEAVPFSDRTDAEAFVQEYGGEIVAFDAIPRDYVLGDADSPLTEDMHSDH